MILKYQLSHAIYAFKWLKIIDGFSSNMKFLSKIIENHNMFNYASSVCCISHSYCNIRFNTNISPVPYYWIVERQSYFINRCLANKYLREISFRKANLYRGLLDYSYNFIKWMIWRLQTIAILIQFHSCSFPSFLVHGSPVLNRAKYAAGEN